SRQTRLRFHGTVGHRRWRWDIHVFRANWKWRRDHNRVPSLSWRHDEGLNRLILIGADVAVLRISAVATTSDLPFGARASVRMLTHRIQLVWHGRQTVLDVVAHELVVLVVASA